MQRLLLILSVVLSLSAIAESDLEWESSSRKRSSQKSESPKQDSPQVEAEVLESSQNAPEISPPEPKGDNQFSLPTSQNEERLRPSVSEEKEPLPPLTPNGGRDYPQASPSLESREKGMLSHGSQSHSQSEGAYAASHRGEELHFSGPYDRWNLGRNLLVESQSSVLTVGARIDVGFSAGTEVYQGFTIPAIRLNALGAYGKYVEYGLSLGQTREFSTALLPQLLPVDAYVTLKAPANDYGTIRCTVGMFNPMENPWWTPDLAVVPLPDYHATHRMVLLDNDVGMELSYQPMDGMVKITVGYFNGNGIFNLNTNNAKAFTGSLVIRGDWGNSKVQLGFGTHRMEQAVLGNVNFKSSWAFDAFASIESGPLLLGVDSFVAGIQDSFRSLSPRGSAGFLHFAFFHGLGLFGRVEAMIQSPVNGGSLTTWQVGPKWQLGSLFQGYFLYEYYRLMGAEPISSGQVRLRVSL